MINEDDEFGYSSKLVATLANAARLADSAKRGDRDSGVEKEYARELAKEITVSDEKRGGLNLVRPMSVCPDAPRDWLANAKKKHGYDYQYDLRGTVVQADECFCIECIQRHRPDLSVGRPAATENLSVEDLEERGYVGVYQPPPAHCDPCPVCGVVIESYEAVDNGSEMVHFDCLSGEAKKALRAVGYDLTYLIRKKEKRDDREVADGQRNHGQECEGSAEGGREPVQGAGAEGRALVEGEAEGPGEQPGRRGVDVHPDEAGTEAQAGPEEGDGPGGEHEEDD